VIAMNNETSSHITIADQQMSRRGVLRVGGLTVSMAALVAACTDTAKSKNPARVGEAAAPAKLADAIVNDGVLFRTATSIHYSVIDSHNISKKLGKLSAAQTAIVDDYISANEDAIKALQKLSETAGGKKWTCANPRFDRVILGPIQEHIIGRPKQGSEETDVAASDDPTRDALALAHAMETAVASMHQALVVQLSLPTYRAAVMEQGHLAARRAAALALAINAENLVNPLSLQNANVSTPTTVAATTTTVQNIAQGAATTTTAAAASAFDFQHYYAIPSQFGSLNAVQLGVGKPSGGAQFTINIETPSLNSFIYDDQTGC
jgi:hypothetical protein